MQSESCFVRKLHDLWTEDYDRMCPDLDVKPMATPDTYGFNMTTEVLATTAEDRSFRKGREARRAGWTRQSVVNMYQPQGPSGDSSTVPSAIAGWDWEDRQLAKLPPTPPQPLPPKKKRLRITFDILETPAEEPKPETSNINDPEHTPCVPV